jgi:hypothetical protein
MNITQQTRSPYAHDDPEAAGAATQLVTLVVARAVPVAASVLVGLVICPPLMILAVVAVVPLVGVARYLGGLRASHASVRVPGLHRTEAQNLAELGRAVPARYQGAAHVAR